MKHTITLALTLCLASPMQAQVGIKFTRTAECLLCISDTASIRQIAKWKSDSEGLPALYTAQELLVQDVQMLQAETIQQREQIDRLRRKRKQAFLLGAGASAIGALVLVLLVR